MDDLQAVGGRHSAIKDIGKDCQARNGRTNMSDESLKGEFDFIFNIKSLFDIITQTVNKI